MSEQLQQLQHQTLVLKARLFDVQEEASQQLKGLNDVFAALAKLLNLSKEESVNGDAYVKATQALIDAAKASPVEGELAN